MHILLIIIINLITGSALLIYGVNLMSRNLEKLNSAYLKKILTACTGKLWSALLASTLITAIIQSSTAITVITVGFVNAGLINLFQAVGIIYGTNIGTTVTAQLMSFNITNIAIPVLVIGVILQLIKVIKPAKNIGLIFTGFGLMLLGIKILHSGVPYIRQSKQVYNLFLNYGENIVIALILGMVTTMLVHSSSATVGLTIVLFNSGFISFESAIALTLGDNIGTCITAQLASVGASIPARQTAWAHTIYNIIGVLIALIFLYPFANVVRSTTELLNQSEKMLVANTHTIFNVLSAVVFLPFTKYYVKFIRWVVPHNHGGRFF